MASTLLKAIFYTFIILFVINAFGNPRPLGLELNKSTAQDIFKQYKVIKKEPNYWRGNNYLLDINSIKLSNFYKALVICNDADLVEAVILTIDKNKFEEFYSILSSKYTLIEENIADKKVFFTSNNCYIILEATSQNEEMELVYIINNFHKEFLQKLDNEVTLKHKQIKELL